jgi:hypothetical protein
MLNRRKDTSLDINVAEIAQGISTTVMSTDVSHTLPFFLSFFITLIQK